MNILLILNDPPYGTERSFNALRLAEALHRAEQGHYITVFLLADAVHAAKSGQKSPEGYYSLERMLKGVTTHGDVRVCGMCMDARGLQEDELLPGAARSTMAELAELTAAADQVLVF